jgi:hypothetical protein
MKRRWALLIAVGMVVAVLAVTAVIGGMSRDPRVCPAIGYGYTGPVELLFSTPPVSVAACFGEGCTPQAVAQNDERKWLVPQSAPYLNEPVSVTSIHVEATAAHGGRTAVDLPVETESTGEYPFGVGCGGPFRFKPVPVISN